MSNSPDKNEAFPFSTLIPVRITDINYGKHLGNMATVGIFHQARVLFLAEYGFDELDIDGLGVLLTNSSYTFKMEVKFNTKLIVNVGIADNYSKLTFEVLYKAVDQKTGKEVSSGQEKYVLFDYSKSKTARMPQRFLDFCEKVKVAVN